MQFLQRDVVLLGAQLSSLGAGQRWRQAEEPLADRVRLSRWIRWFLDRVIGGISMAFSWLFHSF